MIALEVLHNICMPFAVYSESTWPGQHPEGQAGISLGNGKHALPAASARSDVLLAPEQGVFVVLRQFSHHRKDGHLIYPVMAPLAVAAQSIRLASMRLPPWSFKCSLVVSCSIQWLAVIAGIMEDGSVGPLAEACLLVPAVQVAAWQDQGGCPGGHGCSQAARRAGICRCRCDFPQAQAVSSSSSLPWTRLSSMPAWRRQLVAQHNLVSHGA